MYISASTRVPNRLLFQTFHYADVSIHTNCDPGIKLQRPFFTWASNSDMFCGLGRNAYMLSHL